jgi:hypothetical protein
VQGEGREGVLTEPKNLVNSLVEVNVDEDGATSVGPGEE